MTSTVCIYEKSQIMCMFFCFLFNWSFQVARCEMLYKCSEAVRRHGRMITDSEMAKGGRNGAAMVGSG